MKLCFQRFHKLMASVNVFYSPVHRAHFHNKYHPEQPLRVENAVNFLKKYENINFYTFEDTNIDTRVQKWSMINGDTYVTNKTPAVLEITKTMIRKATEQLICSNSIDCCFVLCRPPGHHASLNKQGGFCHENNAWYAVTQFINSGLRNICIYDFDAHHGDGTELCVQMATERKYSNVRFISTHAFGADIFPGTGSESNDYRICNIPLASKTGHSSYMRIFRNDVLPFIGNPEILIVSAGYDAHKDDPMKLLQLETQTYESISTYLKALNIPVLFLLEGGYNTDIIGSCVYHSLLPWLNNNKN
jgi:acetoin utilization deacetylase AcuC-like enzyme